VLVAFEADTGPASYRRTAAPTRCRPRRSRSLAYSGSALQVEVLYRLFGLPFLLWLVSAVLLRGHAQRPMLWLLGALAAAFEPVGQGVFLFLGGAGVITP
jgi:hypothetical protein